ncbi:unnamed protein product [Triticum aestivum]|uniref:(bread wheat) hypothetical protein n=1 Tax=Triticum aestivum TaxID=4565 RepID=A0A7G2IGV6_WHEAT|nr:unnamed protein product [Triticum aestivum]
MARASVASNSGNSGFGTHFGGLRRSARPPPASFPPATPSGFVPLQPEGFVGLLLPPSSSPFDEQFRVVALGNKLSKCSHRRASSLHQQLRILDVSRFVLQISCWFDEHNGTRQMSDPLLFPPLQKISSNYRTISPVWLSGLELSTHLLFFGLHLEPVGSRHSTPESAKEPPLNTYKPKGPYTTTIVSVEQAVGHNALGETCHVIIDHAGNVTYCEGQSYEIIPRMYVLPIFEIVESHLCCFYMGAHQIKPSEKINVLMIYLLKMGTCDPSACDELDMKKNDVDLQLYNLNRIRIDENKIAKERRAQDFVLFMKMHNQEEPRGFLRTLEAIQIVWLQVQQQHGERWRGSPAVEGWLGSILPRSWREGLIGPHLSTRARWWTNQEGGRGWVYLRCAVPAGVLLGGVLDRWMCGRLRVCMCFGGA